MSKEKAKLNGYKDTSKDGKLVKSKIEVTKKYEKVDKGYSMAQYRNSIKDISKKVKKYALELSNNLLSIKMGMMDAIREIEVMIKERR